MFKYYLKRIIFSIFNIYISIKYKNVTIGHGSRVIFKTIFGGNNKIGDNTIVGGNVGRCTYIGSNCNLNARIGNYTSISANIFATSAQHPINTFVSSSPVFYSTRKQCGTTYVKSQKFDEFKYIENSKYSIEIGNDVLISYGVTIIGPITIGNGSVIGANSLVNKDVEPYTIVAGVPAKVIGKRFSDDQIKILNKIEWWNKGEEWLKDNVELFDDVNKLIKHFEVNEEL
ncbi:MAG: antibiotic acetyltransferase [Candidatus Delongbacteria bacterium]|nr:antibiotic acetyltransferase [Candidatus Delongbacteria bacterium]